MMDLRRIGSKTALLAGALMVAVAAPSSHAADRQTRDIVHDANRALADGDYQAALDGYREAEVAEPESAELNYNRGLAHYKLGEFTEARRLFNEALATRDLSLEAKAKFNLANCAYSEALEKVDSVPEAIESLREAVGFYRHSLELTPQDDDARVNIEMARLLIKDLLDKQQPQQEQQQQQSGEQQQDQQQQQNQDQPNDEQQEGEPQPEENEQQNPDDQGEEQPQESQPQEGEQDDPQQPSEEQDQPQEMEMTPEQAQRLLQAVRDKERQRRDERARRLRAGRRPVLRDW